MCDRYLNTGDGGPFWGNGRPKLSWSLSLSIVLGLFQSPCGSAAYSSLKKPCLGAVFTFFWNVAVIRSGTTETDGNTDV